MKKIKKIYVPMSADILNSGHLNIIQKAKKYGKVIVGLFTDSAVGEYKRLPLINYNQRYEIMRNIKDVDQIVKQDTWDDSKNLKKIKPEYLIHGDDWKVGIQKQRRAKVIKLLKKWNGKLIEVPYTKDIKVNKRDIAKIFFSPDTRISRLKRLIDSKKIVRFIESHNPITGLLVENLKIDFKKEYREFDGIWSSSLTDSVSNGKPDNQSFELSSRINNLNNIMEVTTKPVLFDADNGGRVEHLPYTIKNLERLGVSAITIEDKIGLKSNSLFKVQNKNNHDSIDNFCMKIKTACDARRSEDFLIVARIESFILGKNLKDALIRAEAYSKAGADLILIHSKINSPKEIFTFARRFKKSKFYRPMVAVPSTYSKVKESELIKNGFKVVIYANHLLRAAYPAMEKVAINILKNKKSSKAEKNIVSIKKILTMIPSN
jgi:phosphoenolpyruvate phosphomutase / 2-hydroxyethylphosphonate cytidylyltransferase